jgi:UDP-N-acetylglucosamine:LPS N-acetylglucosamine transferase
MAGWVGKDESERVLIFSASMGAGHDGAARELAARLSRMGRQVSVVDFLDCMPLRLGPLLRLVYRLQLNYAPWSYETSYRACNVVPGLKGLITLVLSLFAGRSVRRLVRGRTVRRLVGPKAARRLSVGRQPGVVVSTYPFASLVLGRGRQRGWVKVPVATFITDFAVHTFWVHGGVDLHLGVHPSSAACAEVATGGVALATGPVVPARFEQDGPAKDAARVRLGLPEDRLLALVVAGAWGVGDVEATFDALVRTGQYLPVAVCGTNSRLRERLSAQGKGVVLGWTDQMAELMAAADVLVQNAGGLTCMEAFARGLPVVSFHPVAGHGIENAKEMARVGVAPFAVGEGELAQVLADLAADGSGQGARVKEELLCADPALPVAALADSGLPVPSEPALRPPRRRIALAAGWAAAVYLLLNLGADWVSAHGVDMARAVRPGNRVYVGVRLSPSALADPHISRLLAADGMSAIVTVPDFVHDRGQVRKLVSSGVDVADGGYVPESDLHVVEVSDAAALSLRACRLATGHRCRDLLLDGSVNGVDLATAMVEHAQLVRDPITVQSSTLATVTLQPGRVYVLNELGAGPTTTVNDLQELQTLVGEAGLHPTPLSGLR